MQLKCDASSRALGAVLSQISNKNEEIISFACRKLTAPEKKYSAVDRETLAIYWAVKKFRYYLVGRHFTLYSDHNPLSNWATLKDTHNKRSRWITYLNEFDFTVKHIKGSNNTVADGLSRSINAIEDITPLNEDVKLKIIKKYHEDSAHSGPEKTLNLIKRRFNWKNIENDTKEFVGKCNLCSLFKSSNKIPKAPLQAIKPSVPLDSWHLDYIGPLPVTPRGNKFILLMVDQFSKWTEAVPTAIQTAEKTAELLTEHVVTRFGVPSSIISDQGRQFESNVFKCLCEQLKINKKRTTSYHPQANGVAERAVRTLKEKLRILACNCPQEWDKHLSLALMGMRFTIHSSTKHSPFEILFGKLPRTIADVEFLESNQEIFEPEAEYVSNLKKKLAGIYRSTEEALNTSQNAYKKQYDKGSAFKDYQVGDKILQKKIIRSSLDPRYEKPGVIARKISPVNFQIIEDDGKKKIVHYNAIKKISREGGVM